MGQQEHVFVIAKDKMLKAFDLPGKIPLARDINLEKLSTLLATGGFIARDRAELSPTYVQVIPYIFMRYLGAWEHEDTFLAYNRGSKGGEKRLADKWSIGLGGHINPIDQSCLGTFTLKDLYTAARRELSEELVTSSVQSFNDLQILGLMYFDESTVDMVHLAVVMEVSSCDYTTTGMGDNIVEHREATLSELKELELEKWSEGVLESFIKP